GAGPYVLQHHEVGAHLVDDRLEAARQLRRARVQVLLQRRVRFVGREGAGPQRDGGGVLEVELGDQRTGRERRRRRVTFPGVALVGRAVPWWCVQFAGAVVRREPEALQYAPDLVGLEAHAIRARQARRDVERAHGAGQPLTPPAVRPPTRYFSNQKNSTMIGTVMIIAPAIRY